VILVDDLGYSDLGPYGSEIPTPHTDALFASGVRLSQYHTTPVCSPARAALLTGFNPHRAGYASVANADPGFPAYTMEIAADVPTLPEVLRAAGYATFAAGKWHLTRDSAMHDAADRRSWPTQRGFDRFYGILEGLTSVLHPHRLVSDNDPVDVETYPPGYHLTDDLTDRAVSWIRALRAHDATKPFFLYLAHPAVHGPLQAPAAAIAARRGDYAAGWDAVRQARFDRQLASGLFPPSVRLPERNSEPGLHVPPWDGVPPAQRPLLARYMEVYAAMVTGIDDSLGRLRALLAELGELDGTIVVLTSDNGASGEGGPDGTRSYLSQFVDEEVPDTWRRDVPRDLDLVGGPQVWAHYPRGWAMASNTPFRFYKGQTYAGGVRTPFLLSWPAGLPDRGTTRPQYQYVADVLPTLLDLAGVERPATREGLAVQPLDGASFADVLHDPTTPSTHPEQYSEFFGNRSFYARGHKLVTLHRPGDAYDDAEWRLYDVDVDPTETRDLSADRPELVRELSQAWERAARDNGVFPLDDGSSFVWLVRDPDDAHLSEPVDLVPGTPTLERYRSQRLIAYRSFDVDARLDQTDGDQGVLVAHGDQGGGYVLFVEDGAVRLAYNAYGDVVELDGGPLPAGPHHVRVRATVAPGLAWDLALTVDGEPRATRDGIPMLIGMAPFSGIDVGIDRRGPVLWRLHEAHGAFRYTGTLHRVRYTPGAPAPYDPAALVLAALRAYE